MLPGDLIRRLRQIEVTIPRQIAELKKTIDRLGSAIQNQQAGSSFPLSQLSINNRLFLTTSTIGALSGSTLGNGTGDMQAITSGAYSAAGITGLTLYSFFSTTISSGTLVKACLVDNVWLIDTVYC